MSRTIVVGYDDREPAQRALDRAIAEAAPGTDRIVVISVFAMPLDPDAPRNFGTAGDFSDAPGEPIVPPPVEAALAHARARLQAAGVRADLEWAAGDPGVRIIEAARQIDADLVVLGSHHHGFLGKMFGADVAETVRQKAGCEVIVVE